MRLWLAVGFLGAAAALHAQPLSFSSGSSRTDLIELFTSEGCSSCPPAEQSLGELRAKPGLWKEFVPVAFHVNYWDSLGWKDPLAARAFTERQYAYAQAWGSGNVYTPCFVRNGAEWRPRWGSSMTAAGTAGVLRVDVGNDGVCNATYAPVPGPRVPVLAYDVHVALLGGGISSRVTAGENGGSTLTHEFAVLGLADKELVPGAGAGPLTARFTLPAPRTVEARRRALAAWVTPRGSLAPVQATGGWLP